MVRGKIVTASSFEVWIAVKHKHKKPPKSILCFKLDNVNQVFM